MKAFSRWLGLALLAFIALQLYFVLRVALMVVVDPQSTSFQRSQLWQQLQPEQTVRWRQQWVPYGSIADTLKRAVVASEDDGFVSHDGVDWNAIERAWERNARAEERAAELATKRPNARQKPVRIRGGSTITQQLAKNLFLSGERTLVRKGQEFVLALLLEQMLTKQRILEIYLNSVEWGDGVFGAQAAAQRYFGKNAAQLSNAEAARLAVMLPAPKRFERQPQSAYLNGRTRIIMGRMARTELP
ncbi:monofunctional biosynthetic peptidoglycan transglycosylase [Diaphorobacter sp.]|uniref:monofunctional biosynthetic peptidoglycan transglycosylase n=1 Tax=Diaphorobacter sp. TaxID=1934310 RepID=UPI0028AA3748|nr:monofunctional biosynthetic peptidoglycan transglycosylase [Diaphorobacter sp.]